MEFRITSSLSIGRPVIVNIRIINASTPKCLCCPDWRYSEIFRNSYGKNYPWLNIYILSPLTKSKNEHLKERKTHTSVNHAPENKLYKLVIFIFSSLISLFLLTRVGRYMELGNLAQTVSSFWANHPLLPELVKLLTISSLDGTSLKLVDKFTYLGSTVSSTEEDIDTRLT